MKSDIEMRLCTKSSPLSSIETVELHALKKSAYAMNGSEEKVKLESFSSLKPKVLTLIAQLFPTIEDPGSMFVEDVGAGTFNRVIGVTLPPARNRRSLAARAILTLSELLGFTKAEEVQARRDGAQFVIRIPMDDRAQDEDLEVDILADVSILHVLGPRLPLSIPKVFKYDLDTTNPIGRPYVLQGRLPGQNFNYHIEAMNDRQLASAVVEITRLIEKIAAVTSDRAGCISHENINLPASDPVIIDQFTPAMPFHGLSKAGSAPPQSPVEFLKYRCQRWRARDRMCTRNSNYLKLWDQILIIVDSLDRRGWLGSTFHLVHEDLFPRNILGLAKDNHTAEITGIVDWDMCAFVPKCVALRPPSWAWMDRYGRERDEDNALYEPNDVRGAMAKQAFLSTASYEFVNFALAPESVLARKLFDIAILGLLNEDRRVLGERLVERWHRLHLEDQIFKSPYFPH